MASSATLFYSLVAACFLSVVFAQQNNTGAYTSDNRGTVGWQASPTRRGTVNIIINCLFTILACTWSIQHLNVPDPKDNFWRKATRKCKWALLTVLFPEYLLAHAISELDMALKAMKHIEDSNKDSSNKITVRFPRWLRLLRQLRSKDGQPLWKGKKMEGKEEKKHEWTLTHAYYVNMGGFRLVDDNDSEKPCRHLTTAQLTKHLGDINIPSEDEIKDKSKADIFTKALAVVQILSLLMSIITRAALRLAFSQLELLTLAFAGCGVLIYVFCWYKPQEIQTATQVRLSDLGNSGPGGQIDSLWDVLTNTREPSVKGRIPNDHIPRVEPDSTHYILYLLAITSLAFGGIHLVAWNFEFPTLVEKIMWRTATLLSAALPPISLMAIPLSQVLVGWGDPHEFRAACLQAMGEYAWNISDNSLVLKARKDLEDAHDNREPERDGRPYREIFNPSESNGLTQLGPGLLAAIQKNRSEFPPNFPKQFELLTRVIEGTAGSKRLHDAARTDLFPQKSLLSGFTNITIVYSTGIVYCLARLAIIALAFSCLRAMPDSVYETTWASIVPAVQ